MPGKIDIKEISAAQTWTLRQQVMWPEKPLSFVQLPEDNTGYHFGLFADHQLVSVISLFIQKDQAQFRKFCTSVPFQGKGYGRKLLDHVLDFARSHKASLVWCHARTTACSFYVKAGMQVQGEEFIKNGLSYLKMEKRVGK